MVLASVTTTVKVRFVFFFCFFQFLPLLSCLGKSSEMGFCNLSNFTAHLLKRVANLLEVNCILLIYIASLFKWIAKILQVQQGSGRAGDCEEGAGKLQAIGGEIESLQHGSTFFCWSGAQHSIPHCVCKIAATPMFWF